MTGKITIDKQNATIDIKGTITPHTTWTIEKHETETSSFDTFDNAIKALQTENIENITVNIKSTGGNVNEAILMYETLVQTNKNITTKCFGYVASAATIIAQAASKGKREISANALYLIHNSMCQAEGNSQEITRSLDMLAKTDKTIAKIYAARSEKPINTFTELMNQNNGAGKWIEPKEVIKYGLADKIISSQPITPEAIKTISNMGLPPIPNIERNRKNIAINLRKHWNTILNILGIDEFEQLQNREEYGRKESKDTALQAIQDYKNEIENLKNKVASLETENERLSAKPTLTKTKEDPAIHDLKRTANEQAYVDDLQKFK